MTGKLLDAVGAVVVAVVVTKALEAYGNYKYNKGVEAGKAGKA